MTETVTVYRCPVGHVSTVTRFPDFEGVRRCFFCPGCGRKERGGPNDTICEPFDITIPSQSKMPDLSRTLALQSAHKLDEAVGYIGCTDNEYAKTFQHVSRLIREELGLTGDELEDVIG